MKVLEWCAAHWIALLVAGISITVLTVVFIVTIVRKRRKKSAVKKILKTTDGYFNDKPAIDKTRRVAVVEQRKDDGALAVVKLYSQKGRKGSAFIANLVLTPEEHAALTENSIVGSQVIIGVKKQDGTFKPIFIRELEETDDQLTDQELMKVKKGVHNDNPKHRKTYKNKMKKWRHHFKK